MILCFRQNRSLSRPPIRTHPFLLARIHHEIVYRRLYIYLVGLESNMDMYVVNSVLLIIIIIVLVYMIILGDYYYVQGWLLLYFGYYWNIVFVM